MNPFQVAVRGKGIKKATERMRSIAGRYGLDSRKMDRALAHFCQVLSDVGAGATFPITAAAMSRSPGLIGQYRQKNIEFAVHGHRHIDHSNLSREELETELSRALLLFEAQGITPRGYRSPYLRSRGDALGVLRAAGFLYDSTESVAWDVVGGRETAAYLRALEFYGARQAERYPALPREEAGIVEIPYCLPDDEALVERLHFDDAERRSQPWIAILEASHRRGELFTLGLHPERIFLCDGPLRAVLHRSAQLTPPVWIARLDEIAAWWSQRARVCPRLTAIAKNEYRIASNHLDGLVVLARGIEVAAPAFEWADGYKQLASSEARFVCGTKPVVGVSASSDPRLGDFLRQQGFIVETDDGMDGLALRLHYPRFSRSEERRVLAEIEGSGAPLVRLGRWPHGAKSALSITGDIDALTMWDYLMRLWEK
jgi:peptidoglycan/xylan/chitin deacetylase (PgdA/CDA1 family)